MNNALDFEFIFLKQFSFCVSCPLPFPACGACCFKFAFPLETLRVAPRGNCHSGRLEGALARRDSHLRGIDRNSRIFAVPHFKIHHISRGYPSRLFNGPFPNRESRSTVHPTAADVSRGGKTGQNGHGERIPPSHTVVCYCVTPDDDRF